MANAKGFAEFVATVPMKDVGYILVAVDIDETENMPMTIASNVQQDVARKLIKSLLRQWDDIDLQPIASNKEIVVQDDAV